MLYCEMKSITLGGNYMFTQDIDTISSAAVNKVDVCNHHTGIFFVRAIMAGFWIVVAILLSNVTASVLYGRYPEIAKVIGALLFPIAIGLVVFIGGELFTGNNLTMALGFYNKKVSLKNLLKVWGLSYVGNFLGCVVLSLIFTASGAARQTMTAYYRVILPGKMSASTTELFLRGILCNFLVCLAVWTGTRMKSECGKLVLIFCIISCFVISGFEHCIANMGFFTIGYALCPDIMSTADVIRNMIVVTLGNIVGGAILLSGPLKLMSYDH